MDELCNQYLYAELSCIIIIYPLDSSLLGKTAGQPGQRPRPTFLVAPRLHMAYI